MAASKAKVDGLIANSTGKFTEADRTWLTAMSDEQIDKFVGMGIDTAKAERANAEAATTEAVNRAVAEALKANEGKKPATVEEFIASAPGEISTMLAEGVRMQRDRKNFLVEGLKANKANRFSEDELKAMSLQMLENLASLGAGNVDYSGAGGGPRLQTIKTSDVYAAPMPEAFPKKTA